jgi:hypothetical protein
MATASLHVVPGLYHADSQTEYLFDGLRFEVLYSESDDVVAPTLVEVRAYTLTHGVGVHVVAADTPTGTGVSRVRAICDDGQGAWQGVELVQYGTEMWTGLCPVTTARFYVQVVDGAGNVETGAWRTARPGLQAGLLLAEPQQQETRPGTVITYTHTLTNTGAHTETVRIAHHSTQGWTVTHRPALQLGAGHTATLSVGVVVPAGTVAGVKDVTHVTATLSAVPTVQVHVTDTTMVIWHQVYLPLVLRN